MYVIKYIFVIHALKSQRLMVVVVHACIPALRRLSQEVGE
jgi:hypothetical protein